MAIERVGQRIRRLRMERGMSLAQVAGADFSRAFLNQVELGRSQASMRVLRVVARRLGASIEYVLEGSASAADRELDLERGRVALLLGDFEEALELLRPAAEAGEYPQSADARIATAEALLGLGRDAEARAILDAEEAIVRERRDDFRLRQVRSLRAGGRFRPSARRHVELAERALAAARPEAALEHYRAARILLTGPRARSPRGGELRSPGAS